MSSSSSGVIRDDMSSSDGGEKAVDDITQYKKLVNALRQQLDHAVSQREKSDPNQHQKLLDKLQEENIRLREDLTGTVRKLSECERNKNIADRRINELLTQQALDKEFSTSLWKTIEELNEVKEVYEKRIAELELIRKSDDGRSMEGKPEDNNIVSSPVDSSDMVLSASHVAKGSLLEGIMQELECRKGSTTASADPETTKPIVTYNSSLSLPPLRHAASITGSTQSQGSTPTSTTHSTATPPTASNQSRELERELLLTLVNDLRNQSKRDQHRISALKSRIEELALSKVNADRAVVVAESKTQKERELQQQLRKNITSLAASKAELQKSVATYREMVSSQLAMHEKDAQCERDRLLEKIAVVEANHKSALQNNQRVKDNAAWRLATLQSEIDALKNDKREAEASMSAYKDLCIAHLAISHHALEEKNSPPKVVFADGLRSCDSTDTNLVKSSSLPSMGALSSVSAVADEILIPSAASLVLSKDLLSAFGSRCSRDLLSPFRSTTVSLTTTPISMKVAARSLVCSPQPNVVASTVLPSSSSASSSMSMIDDARNDSPSLSSAVSTSSGETKGTNLNEDLHSERGILPPSSAGNGTVHNRSQSPRGILKKTSPPHGTSHGSKNHIDHSPSSVDQSPAALAAALRTIETLEMEFNVLSKTVVTRDIELSTLQRQLDESKSQCAIVTTQRDELRKKLARDRFGSASNDLSFFVPIGLRCDTQSGSNHLRLMIRDVLTDLDQDAAVNRRPTEVLSSNIKRLISSTDSSPVQGAWSTNDELTEIDIAAQKNIVSAKEQEPEQHRVRNYTGTSLNWLGMLTEATTAFAAGTRESFSGYFNSRITDDHDNNADLVEGSNLLHRRGEKNKSYDSMSSSMTLCDDTSGTITSHTENQKGTGEGCQDLQIPYQRIDQYPDHATVVSCSSVQRNYASNDVPMIAPPTASSSFSSTYRHRNHQKHHTTDTSTMKPPECTPLVNMLASSVSIHSALMTTQSTSNNNSDVENEISLNRLNSLGNRSTKGKTLFRELKQPPSGGAGTDALSSIGKPPYRPVFNLSPFNKEADVMTTTDPATLARLGSVEMWGTPVLGTPVIVESPTPLASSNGGLSTSTSSTRPDSKLYPSKNHLNDHAVNRVADTALAVANHPNPHITSSGHNQANLSMQMIDVKIKEVGKDLSTIDSSDFDIDDITTYGVVTTALTTAGNSQTTTSQDGASTYEWGDVDADSSTGSSSCSDYNHQEGHVVHETSKTKTSTHSMRTDADASDPVQPKNKSNAGSKGTLASIISLLNPTIT